MDDETVPYLGCQDGDWEACAHLLPERPKSFIEERLTTFFAVDFMGVQGQDYYCYMYPNGVCVVGLAPSHSLVRMHRGLPPYEEASSNPVSCTTHAQPKEEAGLVAMGEAGASTTCAQDSSETENGSGAAPPRRVIQPVSSFPLSRVGRVNFDSGRNPNKRNGLKQSGKHRTQGTILRPESVLCRLESNNGECVILRCVVPGKLLELNQRLAEHPKLIFERPCREGYLAVLYPSDLQLEELQRTLLPATDYLKLRGLTLDDLA